MLRRVSHSSAAVRALFIALALSALLLAMPASAFAAKKVVKAVVPLTAEQSATIAAAQADFGTKVANYIAITRELRRAEDDVARTSSEIASGQVELDTARSALATRAVELYRNPAVGLLESLLTANSLGDLLNRANYLAIITNRDAELLKRLRLAQQGELWLQESLQLHVVTLRDQQKKADKMEAQLLADLKTQQAQIQTQNSAQVAASVRTYTAAGSDPSTGFNPGLVVSANNFRNGGAMTVADIQAFLDAQPGALKSYRGVDHFGKTKSAAEMISEASTIFNINPKIILATLQKEQSLLTTKNPTQKQYNGAMGAGMPDSKRNDLSMQGFGNQIYWGAQKFNKNALDWTPGKYEPVDRVNQVCQNEGTFAQYRYTPHYSGVKSFWLIFWRYFGDPVS